MNLINVIFVLLNIIPRFFSEVNLTKTIHYSGEKFPVKYLVPDGKIPNMSDLKYYLRSLKRTVGYLYKNNPNATDANTAIALFYMKSLLKRTLLDSKKNFDKKQLTTVAGMINKADSIISHFVYMKSPYGWRDLEYRVSRLLKDDSPQVYSISEFNRDRLTRWILRKEKMNDFIEQFDDITLPKEKYAVLVDAMDDYFDTRDSDECISRIALNPEPINVRELRQCRPDHMCTAQVLATPSVAYALSHRLLIIMALRQIRRCYVNSVQFDDHLIDALCANMYREAVYIARRGYFARDIFLEHVGFCSMLGYEEFHRHNWFNKAASWIDENGCIHEVHNFQINHTKNNLELYYNNSKTAKKIRKARDIALLEECHSHPIAVLVIFMANAIRHAAYFMSK